MHPDRSNKNTHAYKLRITSSAIMCCAQQLHGFIPISMPSSVIAINLCAVDMHCRFQCTHLFLSTLSNVAYYLYQLFRIKMFGNFFSILCCCCRCHRRFDRCEICWLPDHFHTSCVLVVIGFEFHFFRTLYFVSFSQQKMILNSLIRKRQINFKVCRAISFHCLFFQFYFFLLYVAHFSLSLSHPRSFSLSMFSQCLAAFFLLISFSLNMDKNKVTKQNLRSEQKEQQTKIWRKRKMQTDFPYRFCVCFAFSPRSDERYNKTATIHIVHRKTQNKSHVRTHNVLQTSYITCSFTYLCTKCLFFISAHLMRLHREMRLVVCRFYFLRKERKMNKIDDFLWLKMSNE